VPDGISALKSSKKKVVAKRLWFCTRTIFRWANDGKLARHKIYARIAPFAEADVLAFGEEARVKFN
jgi:hypothetical protein